MSNPNDPAYPSRGYFFGLTKRELFAAMAMQGLFADGASAGETIGSAAKRLGITLEEYQKDCAGNYAKLIARIAVVNADALLAELAKPIQ